VVESGSRAGNQRLLVLGAGPAQLGLLETARALGLWVAVVDRDPAAPGFRFADRRCILSTEDEAGIERLAGALGIDGLIAPGTDWPVGVAARIAARLGLPHPITPATAVAATNKLRQRERLAEAGIPQPRSWVVGGDDEAPAVSGPVVVKAPDRQGQKGLTLVEDPARLPGAIGTARSASRNGLALVEELVDGPEVTVIGFSISGVFTALAVTDRITADPPAFGVALAHVFESPHAEAAALVAAGAARALGIEDGPSYTQLRVGPDGPQVIEVAARLGGGHDAELVFAATGVDLNRLAIASAFDEPVGAPEPQHRAIGIVTRFLVAPPGELERVDVPEGLEGVATVRIYREPGFAFTPLRHASDRAGAILVLGEDREQAVARAEAAAQRIRFVTADAGALLQAN
jgi:biotin carboxylase